MQATVIKVVTGLVGQGRKGPYDYSDFIYQPDPYEGKVKDQVKRMVFANLPIHDDVVMLDPGDRVELGFEKNGKFSNLVSVQKIGHVDPGAAAPPQATDTTKSKGSSTYLTFDQRKELDRNRDRSICKQVALKAAVDLSIAVLKKGDKVDVDDVNEMASNLYGFLLSKGGQLHSTTKQNTAGENSEPTYNPDDDLPF